MKNSLLWTSFLILALTVAGCSAPPEVMKGEKALEKKDYDEAARQFEIAAKNNPEEKSYQQKLALAREKAAQNHYEKGQALRNKFRLKEAQSEFEIALNFQPSLTEARRELSKVQAYMKLLKEKIARAKSANKRQDWFRAEKILYPDRKYKVTFPEVGQIWEEAAKESFTVRMNEGKRYYHLRRYERAKVHFSEAIRLKPQNKPAQKMLKLTNQKMQSRELFYSAIHSMQNNKYDKARELIKKSIELDSGNKRAKALFQEATREGAKAHLKKAEKSRKEGEILEAYFSLLEAESLQPTGKNLVEKIKDRLKDIKKRMAARWYVKGDQLERDGKYGAAWVRFRQASLIWPGFSNVAERLKKIEEKFPETLHYRLAVLPNGGGQRVLKGALKKITLALTAELQKQLPSKLFTCYPYEKIQNGKAGGAPLSGVIRLELNQFDIVPTPDREDKKKKYVAIVGKSLNPNKRKLWHKMKEANVTYQDATSKWKQAQEKLAELKENLKKARENLDEYIKKNPPKKSLVPREEASDPRAIKIEELKVKIKSKERNLEEFQSKDYPQARDNLQEAKKKFEKAKATYLQEPVFQEEKKIKQYEYTLLTITKKGTAQAKLVLDDFISKKTLLEKAFDFSVSEKDVTQLGFPLAGVEKDPLKLPSNAEMSEKMTEGLLKNTVPALQKALQSVQDRFIKAMEQSGKTASLHYAVLAFRARQDPSYRARNKIDEKVDQELVKKIIELTGYDIEKNRLILKKLTF